VVFEGRGSDQEGLELEERQRFVLVLRQVHQLDLEGHILLQKAGQGRPAPCGGRCRGLLHGPRVRQLLLEAIGVGQPLFEVAGVGQPHPSQVRVPRPGQARAHRVGDGRARLTLARAWVQARACGEPRVGQAVHPRGAVRPRAPRLAHAWSRAPYRLAPPRQSPRHPMLPLRLRAHATPSAAGSRRRR
jgi:hypothetical protein